MKMLNILKRELIPAMGCTEPIAICYAAAKAREVLGEMPVSINLKCSGSLYKNAKSVNIPNSNGMTGVKISAILGTVGGDASKGLEVLANITPDDLKEAKRLMDTNFCHVELLKGGNNVHIVMQVCSKEDTVTVELLDSHTNIVKIEKNSDIIFKKDNCDEEHCEVLHINSFAEIESFLLKPLSDEVRTLISEQISYNMVLAEEGLKKDCSYSAGRLLLERAGGDPFNIAKAYCVSASDARMQGVSLPAMSVGGSGNQGITLSVPANVYGKEKGIELEKIIKAVVFSDLVYLYMKQGIGRLSAFCSGIASSAATAGAIIYMEQNSFDKAKQAITNVFANVSGIICDGAKYTCPLKLASCLDAAYLAIQMVNSGKYVAGNTGIIGADFEKTVSNVGILASKGMKETNDVIIEIMYETDSI